MNANFEQYTNVLSRKTLPVGEVSAILSVSTSRSQPVLQAVVSQAVCIRVLSCHLVVCQRFDDGLDASLVARLDDSIASK